jgi:MFS family permease
VVWYTSQFYALFFITITQKVDYLTAYWLIAIALADRHALFFGWLSDRIGRLRIIIAGCVIAALTYFPSLPPWSIPPCRPMPPQCLVRRHAPASGHRHRGLHGQYL